MRERDRAVVGSPRIRGDQCNGCAARMRFARYLEVSGAVGSWLALDPVLDLTAGVQPSHAVRFERRRGLWVCYRLTTDRPRGEGWKVTTVHAATCSAARRRLVPANERPVGRDDLVEDPTLFDHPITNP